MTKASELLLSTANPFDTACMQVRELEDSLQSLIDLKDHKDRFGKDDWYLAEQPRAWDRARKALSA